MIDPAVSSISDATNVSLPLVVSIVGAMFGFLSMILAALGRAREKILIIGIETAKQQADMALTKYADSLRDNAAKHAEMTERIHSLEVGAALGNAGGQSLTTQLAEMRSTMVSKEYMNMELRAQTGEVVENFRRSIRTISSAGIPEMRPDSRSDGPGRQK